MMTLITGGSKSGKSRYAEKIPDTFTGKKIYIATMRPYGDEAADAIIRHRKMRSGKGFETVEQYTDIHRLSLPADCSILLECMGNLCANEMFKDGAVCDPTEKIIMGVIHLKKIASELIIVTNETGSDGISYESGTQKYISVLGEINRQLVAIADNVIECVYGIPVALKGEVLC